MAKSISVIKAGARSSYNDDKWMIKIELEWNCLRRSHNVKRMKPSACAVEKVQRQKDV